MKNQFPRVFSDYLMPFRFEGERSEWNTPACDIEEDEKAIHVTMDVPGMKKDDIKIELKDNVLWVSGERYEEQKDTKTKRVTERNYGSFERSFTLPSTVEADKVTADYENGVLKLELPKAATAKGHLIRIGERRKAG